MSIAKTIKSTFIYFLGNVLSKLVVFLLLPIYTSYISPEAMGTYDNGVTVITLFSNMLFLDIGTVILKFSLERNSNNKNSTITNGFLIFMISSSVYFILMILCSCFIKYEYIGLLITYGFIYSFNYAVGYVARSLHHNTDYAVSGVIQTIIMVLINIILLIKINLDYKSLYISFITSSIISSLYLIIKIKIYKHINKAFFDKKIFNEMVRFALPLCVNSMAFWLLSSSGRVIVNYTLGNAATGYLSIGNKFTQILYLVSNCVHLTWQETAFTHDNANEKEKGFYSKIFTIYYKIVFLSTAILILGIKIGLYIFPNFIDSSYSISINLIPTALIGTALAIISQFLGTIFSAIKKTNVIFLSTLCGAITTVITTFLFIHLECGPVSANLSFICGYMISLLLRIVMLKKYIGMKFKFQNLLWIAPLLLLIIYIYIYHSIFIIIFTLLFIVITIPLIFSKELKIVRRKIYEHRC